MRRPDGERVGAFVAALGALLVAATYSREGRLAPVPRGKPPRAKSAASAGPGVSRDAPPSPAAAPPAPRAPGRTPLEHFEHALSELAQKSRRDHVRIVWLGDSHTNADFMTGAVRRKLGERFGAGGPGLVRLGAAAYRHDGVKLARDGRFLVEPEPPSRRTAEGDTAFGYYGLRAVPLEPRARVEAHLDGRSVKGDVHYELLFDRPPHASFRLSVGGTRRTVDARTSAERVPGSPILRLRAEGRPNDAFELDAMRGAPRFYGVIAEGSEPGVVLDTSGIDGARVATALAWNDAVFAAELGARAPDLVVVAYGTNEAFDNRRAELIGDDVSALVERVRRGAPDADCFVLAPPDAAAPDYSSLPHVAEIELVLERTAARLGCGFFSLRAAMGGEGGFARWLRETPPLARGDRIHFTPAGYEVLGAAVAAALTRGLDAGLTR